MKGFLPGISSGGACLAYCLPAVIDEPIDFDGDGTPDFQIHLTTDTDSAHLEVSGLHVVSIREVLHIEDTRIACINLTKTPRP